jgi:flavin-dependent dehydrogenase
MTEEARPRVVIVGGGFAGLFAARALRRAPVEVRLIDRAEHHLFQPLLYQCATGILSEGKIAAWRPGGSRSPGTCAASAPSPAGTSGWCATSTVRTWPS